MEFAPKLEDREYKIIQQLKYFSRILGIAALVVGILVLFGWQLDIEFFKRIYANSKAMNPISALCFCLCGIALYFFHDNIQKRNINKIIVSVCAGITLLISIAKLVSIFTQLHLPVDHIFFSSKFSETQGQLYLPNGMTPNTAFNFALSGLAILILNTDNRKSRYSQMITIFVVMASLISLYFYIYGVRELYGIMRYIPMAVHTSFCFIIISMGILFARPQAGPMAIVVEGGSREILFIEIFALFLPLVFGWLQLKGQHAGYYSNEFGTALFVVLTYIISIFFLGRSYWLQHTLKMEKEIADAAMLEHAQQLQSILDSTATPIVIKDAKGRYTLVNKQFEALFHVNSEDILGKTVYNVFSKDIADNIYKFDNEALQTGQLKHIEEEYPVGNELHTFITVKFPLRDTRENIYALCSISTDITYRKQLEDTLRTNEQQLRSILQNIGEGVVVVDTKGKFLSFNKVAKDILGIGATEGALSSLAERYGVFRPDGVTPYPSEELSLAKALRGISTDEVELFIRNKKFPEGKQISVTGRPVFNDKQEVIAGVVVFRDITQNKKLLNIIR